MVVLDGHSLTVDEVARVAQGAVLSFSDDAMSCMQRSAGRVEQDAGHELLTSKWAWLTDGPAPADPAEMVRVFLRGHCAGVGPPLDPGMVRASIACRMNVWAVGRSGVRPSTAQAILAQLNAGIVPVVPSLGSLGGAGCAQLAHAAWVMAGLGGKVWNNGRIVPAGSMLRDVEVPAWSPKEALSFINGPSVAAARGAIACSLARRLVAQAESIAALSFEVVRADLGCLSEEAIRARRHPGAVDVAVRMRRMLEGSELCTQGRQPDPFSVRCAPAVLGAAIEALDHVLGIVEREINGASDNPLVDDDGGFLEAGNFHGASLGLALDYAKVALTQAASMSERRTFRMTYGQLSGLPSYLVPSSGLNSGLMLAQYTAASLVSECRGLAYPASVGSIPVVQHREDHSSMAAAAAEGLERVAAAFAQVLAIELLCAAQGLDFHLAGEAVEAGGALVSVPTRRPGRGTGWLHAEVRKRVPRWVDDRVLHPDVRALADAISEGVFRWSPDDGPGTE
jgi:histidine ammonia-lyase